MSISKKLRDIDSELAFDCAIYPVSQALVSSEEFLIEAQDSLDSRYSVLSTFGFWSLIEYTDRTFISNNDALGVGGYVLMLTLKNVADVEAEVQEIPGFPITETDAGLTLKDEIARLKKYKVLSSLKNLASKVDSDPETIELMMKSLSREYPVFEMMNTALAAFREIDDAQDRYIRLLSIGGAIALKSLIDAE